MTIQQTILRVAGRLTTAFLFGGFGTKRTGRFRSIRRLWAAFLKAPVYDEALECATVGCQAEKSLMRRMFLVIILLSTGFLNAQTNQSADEPQPPIFSTCVVTLTASSDNRSQATITGGVVEDVNGHKWALPHLVTIPKNGKIRVTATSVTPGPITALPGQIRVIVTPQFGWRAVTNDSSAIPGQLDVEADCEKALRRQQSKVIAFDADSKHNLSAGNEFDPLIPVQSDEKMDVYVTRRDLDLAINDPTQNSGLFEVSLYFVYRNEGARLQAIAAIQRNNRDYVLADKLKTFKYVVMDVNYSRYGCPNCLTSDGHGVPGPTIGVSGSGYLSPTGCDLYDYQLAGVPGYPGAEYETLWPSRHLIGSESLAFLNSSGAPRWSLLLGDLNALKTGAGFYALKINSLQTPLFYQIILNVSQKIAEGKIRDQAYHP